MGNTSIFFTAFFKIQVSYLIDLTFYLYYFFLIILISPYFLCYSSLLCLNIRISLIECSLDGARVVVIAA